FNGPQLQESSIGTGFAVAKDIVVSNRHVVSDTDATYSVVDSDGDKLDVVDIYRDPLNDLALLKISDGDFTPIELGDSDVVRVGQTVIAIGNALGRFSNSVTKGIISGVGRGITASGSISQFQEEIENVLQTDAALNPGNSGGPLLNIAGQVIGVNVAVGVQTENIGFAIPVNTVKELISDYQSGVDRRKPFLGIEYVVITPEFAQNSDLPEGVLVRSVVSDSAADEAGVKINDVITAIDQTNISDSTSLASIIKGYKVNDKVKLSVWRNGQTLELTAQLKASE
ncbi:trypsin-like peptidase domain-containing protein, partial [candidate division WWE3 bacterium]|nr:trypsin-like peptidase domain-containing protein [candidate division WWE3 bacterium]